VTIGQALVAPSGYGLSGRPGARQRRFRLHDAAQRGLYRPDHRVPATGYAELNANGTVKDIIITNPAADISGQSVTAR